MMTLQGGVAGGVLLVVAGLYQFTTLKHACLQHRQSPAEFLVRQRRPGRAGAFGMGVAHGVYCLGCCWSLMALLFVGGVMNLYWIAGIVILVALEKLTPFGRGLARVAGGAMIAGGLALAAFELI
jgi:predicted metal-binding membrane protein